MLDLNSIPSAVCILVAPQQQRGGQGCYLWQVVQCPYCGGKHHHGAGKDPELVDTFLGHRVAHCAAGAEGGGYYLVSHPAADPEAGEDQGGLFD